MEESSTKKKIEYNIERKEIPLNFQIQNPLVDNNIKNLDDSQGFIQNAIQIEEKGKNKSKCF